MTPAELERTSKALKRFCNAQLGKEWTHRVEALDGLERWGLVRRFASSGEGERCLSRLGPTSAVEAALLVEDLLRAGLISALRSGSSRNLRRVHDEFQKPRVSKSLVELVGVETEGPLKLSLLPETSLRRFSAAEWLAMQPEFRDERIPPEHWS